MLQELFPLTEYEIKKYSYSKLSLFNQCKLRYKAKYIEKSLVNDQKNSFYLVIGRFAHRVLREFYDPKNVISPNINEIIQNNWNSLAFEGAAEEKYWREKTNSALSNFINDDPNKNKTILVESSFENKIDSYVLTTIIDRANYLDDTFCEIIEYKFGDEFSSRIDLHENLQWAFHYLAAAIHIKKTHQKEIAYIKYCYLDSGKEYLVYPTHNLILEAIEEIKSQIMKIEEEAVYLPQKNKFCSDCKLIQSCPLFRKAE